MTKPLPAGLSLDYIGEFLNAKTSTKSLHHESTIGNIPYTFYLIFGKVMCRFVNLKGNKRLKPNQNSSSNANTNNSSVFDFLNTMNPDKIIAAGKLQTKNERGKMQIKGGITIAPVKVKQSSASTKNLF